MNHIEIDSVYHLSASKDGVVFGAGITKGSDGVTVDGDSIKAGKFPVLFYGNKQSQIDSRKDRNWRRRLQQVNSELGHCAAFGNKSAPQHHNTSGPTKGTSNIE